MIEFTVENLEAKTFHMCQSPDTAKIIKLWPTQWLQGLFFLPSVSISPCLLFLSFKNMIVKC